MRRRGNNVGFALLIATLCGVCVFGSMACQKDGASGVINRPPPALGTMPAGADNPLARAAEVREKKKAAAMAAQREAKGPSAPVLPH